MYRGQISRQDKRLAEFLAAGKAPRGIAVETSVPLDSIYYRINRLRKFGVIGSRDYTVNFESLGYYITDLILVRTKGPFTPHTSKHQSVIDVILEQKVPGMMIRLIGSSENGTMVFILAHFEKVREIYNFTYQLKQILDVESMENYLVSYFSM